ncbi:hypothetical protein [Streptomyces sp. NPDC058252]|uniref:hypothetical protein n=1 Tax=Streptomyces sp. NPDC058252 TaxID=3346405 RepID=UPI0036E78ABE
MANRTTTTTVIRSEKNDSGEWEEWEKTVTTVVERDDEGYPYGPIQYPYFTPSKLRDPGGKIGDYIRWYDSLGARPAVKREEKEDGPND